MGSSEANRQYLRLNPLRDHEGEYAAGSAANQVLPPRAAKPNQEAKPAKPKDAKPAHQEASKPDDRKRVNPPQKELEKRAQDETKQNQEEQAKPAQHQQRPFKEQSVAENRGGRIPEDHFRAHFGREHTFVINRPVIVESRPRFQYSGYWFEIVKPWPAGWAYTDDCYIDYIDDTYYLFDPLHPNPNHFPSVAIVE